MAEVSQSSASHLQTPNSGLSSVQVWQPPKALSTPGLAGCIAGVAGGFLRLQCLLRSGLTAATGLRKTHHCGTACVGWVFTLTTTAYNLIRLPKLLAAA